MARGTPAPPSRPGPVGGLLLAAGGGRRYGRPKALATTAGRYWVDLAVEVLRSGGCDPVVVVLGAAATEVRSVAELRDTTVVEHPGWAAGMGTSLRAGLAALAGHPASCVAAAVLLVDTPGITAAAVQRVAVLAGPDALAVATYDGVPGHPVLLGREHWPGVAALADGELGARPYLRIHEDAVCRVPCGDIADGADVDRCD